jgi:phasin
MPENTANKARTIGRPTEAAEEFAQQGAAYGKDIYEKSKVTAEETQKALQETYSTVTKGAADFNVQWIEMVRANMNSTLDFARQLVGVKSPSEFIELSVAHGRKQFETCSEQAKHLTGLAQKVTTDAVQPLQASVKTAFNKAA